MQPEHRVALSPSPSPRPDRLPHATAAGAAIRVACGPVVLTGKTVLAPLDLTLGETRIGILGRNGSGKTTLLRLLAGLVAPQSGGVTLPGGSDPAKDRRAALRQIGILFQNPDHQILFPTVEEELAFGLIQLGASRAEAAARVAAALAAEGRGDWAKASISTLSGGQKQYLCLLAVLLMEPATILLDEPFTGLDLPLILRLKRRLAALPQRLITIGHDPQAMAEMDRILWLEEGRLRMDGPPASVIPAYLDEMHRIGGLDADADLAG